MSRSSAKAIRRAESDSITSGASSGSPPNQVTLSLWVWLASSIRSVSAIISSCTSCDIVPEP